MFSSIVLVRSRKATCLYFEIKMASLIVISAGTSIAATIENIDVDEFSRMLQINTLGSIYPTKAAIPYMKTNTDGARIVFVSSQVGQLGMHGYTAYGASKWAIRGFAESLQMETKPWGGYVSVAYPPDTQTPGYDVEMLTKVMSAFTTAARLSPCLVLFVHFFSVFHCACYLCLDSFILV